MKKDWADIVITGIYFAVYVPPYTGRHIHKDRPSHGLVLNDENSVKEYCFSDGRVMRTEGNALFYLPKHSSYSVRTLKEGGCYAINFDAEISDEPFAVSLRNVELLRKSFKIADAEWRSNGTASFAAAMRALYEAIYLLQKEREQSYMPSDRYRLITIAIAEIDRDFNARDLTVERLAALCGMSEVYFRKIFIHSLGISPKEYIIRKRMDYAGQLLMLGDLGVAEIAELCGYAEPCHFSREFKKRFGVPPKEYRG